MMFMAIIAAALCAGIVQGVTGFGAGLVIMMVIPMFFEKLATAAGVSTATCMVLNALMVNNYKKHITWKTILPAAALYILVVSFAINYSMYLNQALLKKVFGVFLIILAIYYLFLDKGERKKLSLPVKVVFIIISACCDAFFGVGGPLMVMFFLSETHNSHEYLGTISAFFLLICIYNTCFRLVMGIIGVEHLVMIAAGMAGILTGGFIAGKIVNKLDGYMLRRLVYIMIGVAGIINIL